MLDKALYFTVGELYFLLLQRDLQGVVIFEELKGRLPDDQEMAQGVLSLAEKGILTVFDDGHYRLSEDIQAALDILERAESAFVVSGYQFSCPMQCLYFYGRSCLSLQMDDYRAGFVRLELMDRAAAVAGVLEYEFIVGGGPWGNRAEAGAAKVAMAGPMERECGLSDGRWRERAEAGMAKVAMVGPMEHECMLSEGCSQGRAEAAAAIGNMGSAIGTLACLEEPIETLLANESIMVIVDRYARNSTTPDDRTLVLCKDERYFLAFHSKAGAWVEWFSDEVFVNVFEERTRGNGGCA